jgi:hypothetical protein
MSAYRTAWQGLAKTLLRQQKPVEAMLTLSGSPGASVAQF